MRRFPIRSLKIAGQANTNWTMRLGRVITGLTSRIAAAARAGGAPFLGSRRPTFTADEFEWPFECEQSVEELETLGYRARDGAPPWPIAIPVDWSADPYSDDNWQFLFQGWGMTDPYFTRYRERGAVSDLAAAANYAADWARFHYEEGRDARYSWFDMSAGIRAMRTAILLDRIGTGELVVPRQTKARLHQIAEDHVRRLQDENYVTLNNHGLFQALGLRMLCALPETQGREEGTNFADRAFRRIIRASYTRNGVHTEHSPYYAALVTSWLDRPGFRRWWSETIERRVVRARPLEPWYVFPNGDVAAIGDSKGRTTPPTDLDTKPTSLPDGRCFAVKDLSADGYAIIRSMPATAPDAASMLFVTGAAHSLTHKHVDDLSFILFEGGRYIFVDTGMAGYTRDLNRRYVLGASAHNTISLADYHIEPKHVTIGATKLAPIRALGNGFVVEGGVERGSLFRQKRTLAYDPGRSLTIRDELWARYRRQYVSSLHLAPDLVPVVDGQGFTVDLGSGRVLRAEIEEPDCAISVVHGQDSPLLGWVARGEELVPTSVIRALGPGTARTITWRIEFAG